jgi:hypothetical protein
MRDCQEQDKHASLYNMIKCHGEKTAISGVRRIKTIYHQGDNQ